MPGKFLLTLLFASLTAGAVVWGPPSSPIAAGEPLPVPLRDADGDFLPDAVEWAVMTSAANPDTDGDTIDDFIEVVQNGLPRRENLPLPPDQQMRLVVTGPAAGSADPLTWMHIFLRVMPTSPTTAGMAVVQSFDTWLELPNLPGLRIPLNSFAAGGLIVRERATQDEGHWIQVSVPLVSAQILVAFLPCTIVAESVVGGVALASGVKLMHIGGNISTLVPFDEQRFALQTIGQLMAAAGGSESNRVCVLGLSEINSGPGGTLYEVATADCEDCNELECGNDCLGCAGMTITIPGGSALLSGN